MSFRGNLMRHGIVADYDELLVTAVLCRHQAAPTAMTTAATMTAAALLAGLITGTHSAGSTQAYTLPSGADLDTALSSAFLINGSFDFTIINLSAALADTITLTASTGITIVGQALIESAHANSEFPNSSTFRVRKTAADTFVCYKI